MKNNFFKLLLLHRRIGLVAIWLVLWLSITGVFLNHSDGWGLDERPVRLSWLSRLYGLEVAPITQGYALKSGWLVALPQGYYLKGKWVADDYGVLVGGLELDSVTLLVTTESVVVLDQEGEVLDVQGVFHGLEGRYLKVGLREDLPALQSSEESYLGDGTASQWQAYLGSGGAVRWSVSETLPASLLKGINAMGQAAQPSVSLERLILDLHTGRLFGRFSWLFMDIFALLLVVGAISGFVIWFRLRVKT